MKMDVNSEFTRRQVSKPQREPVKDQPSAKDIGREFVRQYYTMLSERPSDVYRFYSNESYYTHGGGEPIRGQDNIQKAIEDQKYVECKARIHTVCGTSTVNQGLVIQVCGELSIRKQSPSRRFVQTFILCPQTPKKYYVHNDVFQWLDEAFGDDSHDETSLVSDSDSQSYSMEQDTVTEPLDSVITNGTTVVPDQNGHQQMIVPTTSGLPSQVPAPLVNNNISDLPTDHSYAVDGNDENMGQIKMEQANDESVNDSNSVPPPAPPAATSTWASLFNKSVPAPTPAETTATNVPAQSQESSRPDSHDDIRKIYLGNIKRTVNPTVMTDAEKEIKKLFEAFGQVKEVRIPAKVKVMENTLQSAYAFVTMDTVEGARKVYEASKKDTKGNAYLLHLNLKSFGFDGDATLQQSRNENRGGGFNQNFNRNNLTNRVGSSAGGNYGNNRGRGSASAGFNRIQRPSQS